MKKLLFIINPKAGVKKNKHFVDDALEIFERAGYKVGVKYTKKRADGTRIARDYGAKADLCVWVETEHSTRLCRECWKVKYQHL